MADPSHQLVHVKIIVLDLREYMAHILLRNRLRVFASYTVSYCSSSSTGQPWYNQLQFFLRRNSCSRNSVLDPSSRMPFAIARTYILKINTCSLMYSFCPVCFEVLPCLLVDHGSLSSCLDWCSGLVVVRGLISSSMLHATSALRRS